MVAFVGFAATAFLLTLQPTLALASAAHDIFARQSPASGINASSFPSSCTGCLNVTPALTNSSCISDLSCLCNTTVVSNLESCTQCAVTEGTLNQSDATAFLNFYNTSCNVSSSGNSTTSTTSGTTASQMSISAFGVVITAVLGAIALL